MEIPLDVLKLVATFLVVRKKKLLDWIPENKITYQNWESLSKNPEAIHLLKANPKRIVWFHFSDNPNVHHLLETVPLDSIVVNNPRAAIDLCMLSRNPNAINFLETNPHLINWKYLSANPKAIHLLEPVSLDPKKISWRQLSKNPNGIHLLEKMLKQNPNLLAAIDWYHLSQNPGAIHLLETVALDTDKIHGEGLAMNPNPNCIQLFEKYNKYDICNWFHISVS
jgi:hypothetical protein